MSSALRQIILEEIDNLVPQKILDYPLSRQSESFSCGAAVVQSLLQFYGIKDAKEQDIIDALSTTPKNGTDIDNIVEYLRRMGLRAQLAANLDLERVLKWISQGHPVILSMQAWSDDDNPDYTENRNSHYVVGIGYNNDSLFFEDPSLLGNRGYLPVSEFETRWHDEDGNKRAIFISGKKPDYNSKDFMRIE